MQRNEKTVWHEGLLMSPQHMQAQAHYHEAHLHARLTAVCSSNYGVVHLHLDDDALSDATLRVPSAELIMPSGLVVCWDEAQKDAALTRNLSEAHAHLNQVPTDAAGGRMLDIFIAVACEREGLANVASEGAARSHQRFGSFTRVMAERAFGQTAPVDVLLCVPHVQLLFGHEITKDIEAMHIAQLQLDADGVWQSQKAFAPQALRMHHHGHWVRRLQALSRKLRRATQTLLPLAQMAQASTEAPLRWSDVAGLMRLRALQSVAALVEHVVQDVAATPREGYLMLKQALVAGAPLEGLSSVMVPAYSHTLQHTWLAPMVLALEAMTPGAAVEVTRLVCEAHAAAHWRIALPPRKKGAQTQYFLEVASSQHAQDVADQWVRQAKLAAPDALEHLVRAALAGVKLTACSSLPDHVHPRAGSIYLALDVSDPRLEEAIAQGALAIAPPSHFAEAEKVCLLVVRSQLAPERGP